MEYQKTVIYRNKITPLCKLKPTSNKKIKIVCPECGKVFERYFFVLRKSGCFLCQKCALRMKLSYRLPVGMKKNRLTVIRHSKRAGKSIFKCDCGRITKVLNRGFLSGKTKSCGCIRSENMKKVMVHRSGKDHPNWKGGIAGERNTIMSHSDYKLWRISVFERDGYRCQKCGQKGGNLNVHHIYNYADNKGRIMELRNGATLCDFCHINFHGIYGYRNNNRVQLTEFLLS